jgi:hypothetical protein
LIQKPEGKKPHGRPGHRWEDNIKMDFKQIDWEGVDRNPYVSGKQAGNFLTNSVTIRFSRRSQFCK